MTLASLVADRCLDAHLAALLWLLVEGGVPVTVVGPAPGEVRGGLAAALVAADPARPWVVLDADGEGLSLARLAALLRGGTRLGVTLGAGDLREAMGRLTRPPDGIPEDAMRRLGVVVVAEETGRGLRCPVIHYLRPAERDGQGHVQRRPPAVLAAWDASADRYEDFAWAITPELADRVDRSQADLEDRWRERADFLEGKAGAAPADAAEWSVLVASLLASEPPRVPAPERSPARPSPFRGGLTDPHQH